MPDFVHLHLHTAYSTLDGAIKIPELMQRVLELGMKSVAITDHGSMYGALEFYFTAKEFGVKPIIGIETYIAAHGIDKKIHNDQHHLILLAKDQTGYKNLMRLSSLAFTKGFYYKPRIDRDLLKRYSEGLIALSACLKGEIPSLLLQGKFDEATLRVNEYKSILGENNFYLEIQNNGLEDQKRVNELLLELAETTHTPVCITCDSHYLYKKDAVAHDVLVCIQTHKKRDDENRMRYETDQLYVKSPQEIAEELGSFTTPMENTVLIAKRCNLEIKIDGVHLPIFTPPNGMDADQYLSELAWNGLRKLKQNNRLYAPYDVYEERLKYELSVISKLGFSSYYLIVQDFINYAKKNGIHVGPGRGSGSGSLVAYLIGIINIDPIRFDLMFERFLNPERVSMPDFDVDFCQIRRDEVIQYLREKYGNNHVAKISTFSELKSKSALRDTGRALGLTPAECNRFASLLPEGISTIKDALDSSGVFKQEIAKRDLWRETAEIAQRLEGLYRQPGVHASGIVIADREIVEYTPLFIGKDGQVVTQYDKDMLEKVGLVKFDILGLKTLSIIDLCVNLIKKGGRDIDIYSIPLDDPEVFEIFKSGDTVGVFQMENPGFSDFVKQLKPDRFENIIVATALYRPGPLDSGLAEHYIKRKAGEEEVTYYLDELKEILEETYGIIVYQEQVMKVAMKLAGFSVGEADVLRKAMGKKNPELMQKHKQKFIEMAVARGKDKKIIEQIATDIEKFARYAFNKSHASAYGYLSYLTAYLKRYYTKEFLAAHLSFAENDDVKFMYIEDLRRHNIPLLGFDINLSEQNYSVEKEAVRLGFKAVKNIGEKLQLSIIEERNNNGPFKSFEDFVHRMSPRGINKKAIETLILAGGFDSINPDRRYLLNSMEDTMKVATWTIKSKLNGQTTLFLSQNTTKSRNNKGSKTSSEFLSIDDTELLNKERELLGFYFSGNPLARYSFFLEREKFDIESCQKNGGGWLVGILTKIDEYTTQSGARTAKILITDYRLRNIELRLFQKDLETYKELLQVGVFLALRLQLQKDKNLMRVREMFHLKDLPLSHRCVKITIDSDFLTPESAFFLRENLNNYKGSCPVRLELRYGKNYKILLKNKKSLFRIIPENTLVEKIKKIFNEHVKIDYLITR